MSSVVKNACRFNNTLPCFMKLHWISSYFIYFSPIFIFSPASVTKNPSESYWNYSYWKMKGCMLIKIVLIFGRKNFKCHSNWEAHAWAKRATSQHRGLPKHSQVFTDHGLFFSHLSAFCYCLFLESNTTAVFSLAVRTLQFKFKKVKLHLYI